MSEGAGPSQCRQTGCDKPPGDSGQFCDEHTKRPSTRQRSQPGKDRCSKRADPHSLNKVKKQGNSNRLTPTAALAAEAMTEASLLKKREQFEREIQQAKTEAEQSKREIVHLQEALAQAKKGVTGAAIWKTLTGDLHAKLRASKSLETGLRDALKNKDNNLQLALDNITRLERELAEVRTQSHEREYTEEEVQHVLQESERCEDLSTEDYLAMMSAKITDLNIDGMD